MCEDDRELFRHIRTAIRCMSVVKRQGIYRIIRSTCELRIIHACPAQNFVHLVERKDNKKNLLCRELECVGGEGTSK